MPSEHCFPSLAGEGTENTMAKGKLPQAWLWFLVCHLGSCRSKALVTLRKNELEFSEANKP